MMLFTLNLVIDITHDFERQFAKGKPMAVKFYADWCMDCKLLDEPYDQMSNQFSRKEVVIAEMDCTFNNETTRFCVEKGIRVFPTVKLYNVATEDYTYSHALTSQYDLKKWIAEHLRAKRDEDL